MTCIELTVTMNSRYVIIKFKSLFLPIFIDFSFGVGNMYEKLLMH